MAESSGKPINFFVFVDVEGLNNCVMRYGFLIGRNIYVFGVKWTCHDKRRFTFCLLKDILQGLPQITMYFITTCNMINMATRYYIQ